MLALNFGRDNLVSYQVPRAAKPLPGPAKHVQMHYMSATLDSQAGVYFRGVILTGGGGVYLKLSGDFLF